MSFFKTPKAPPPVAPPPIQVDEANLAITTELDVKRKLARANSRMQSRQTSYGLLRNNTNIGSLVPTIKTELG